MVKSKFPGKPSKLVQRSLVSAFSVSVPSCDTSTITENVCYGLSIFENTFEDEEEGVDFHGFNYQEIQSSYKNKEKFVSDVNERFSALGLTYTSAINKKQISVSQKVVEEETDKPGITLIIAVKPKNSHRLSTTKKERRKCGKVWFVAKKMVNQYHSKVALRHNFKTLNKNSLLRFKHKSLSSNYLSDKYRRKFNLPSRSLHSSRVIKPNKRFIEHEKHSKAVKVFKSGKVTENDVCGEIISDEKPKLEISSSKVIIREARLNITTEPAITGPFSVKKNAPCNSNNSKETTRKGNSTEKERFLPRGPRIKHVCRSASSVLRTSFGNSSEGDTDELTSGSSPSDSNKHLQRNGCADPKGDKNSQLNRIRQCSDNSVTVVDNQTDNDLSSHHGGARSLQDFSKQSSDESEEHEDKLISTDFWEAYDPDEVCKTGFPLISSEPTNIRALCFLCGSAGIEKLLYCVACCEAYHWYCAEGPSAFRDEAELEKSLVNWICRKCKVCSTCGKGGDLKTLSSCKRCRNSYHSECLNNKAQIKRLFNSDRPWVCPSCLKCKSCNSNTVFTHVGNMPLCSQCFKLRQKGNYCPLCQGCYQDEDYNVQMMECGICKCWIHAKCEGISYEKYQILSFLPDTIEFVCRLCCTVPPAQWWLAVEDELKAGFYGVLKSLCNNKKIGDLLKESPRKENPCSCFEFDCDNSTSTMTDLEQTLNSPLAHVKRVSSSSDLEKEINITTPRNPTEETAANLLERRPSCYCSVRTRNGISERLLAIKANVRTNQYTSVFAFNQELENVLAKVEGSDSVKNYSEILKQFFPWFDPKHVQQEEVQNNSVEAIANENVSVLDGGEKCANKDDDYAELRKLMSADEYKYENFKMLDVRKCNLCKGLGEAIASEGGRLIYCGRNEWVHSNCALWSSEVFEEIDGSLQNVHSAISRGRQIRCSTCNKKGASVGCCFKNCTLTYHFLCAKKANCIFLQNKTIFCNNHDLKENNLQLLVNEKDFEILRPIYIEMDRKKKKWECHANVKLRIGSLHVESLGKIDPHLSDNTQYILPIYYRCTRLFWSTTKPWKIVQYHIQIKVSYSYESRSEADFNYTVDHSTCTANSDNDQVVKEVVEKLIEQVCKKNSAQLTSSANNRKVKIKRKLNFEDSSPPPVAKKKTRENVYLSAAKLSHVVVDYHSPFEKLIQLDGMIDIYNEEEPVTCTQCHRTYRTTFSYERHLDTCNTDFGDFMISSCESDSVSSEEEKLSCNGTSSKIASLDNSPITEVNTVDMAFANKYTDPYIIENNDKLTTNMPAVYMNNVAANMNSNSVMYPCTAMTYEDAQLLNNGMQNTAVALQTVIQNLKQDTMNVATSPSVSLPVPQQTIKFNIVDNNGKLTACNTNYGTQLTLTSTAPPQAYVTSTPTYVIQSQYQKPAEMIPTFVAVDNTLTASQPLQSVQLQPLTQSSLNFQPIVPTILNAVVQPNVIEAVPTTTYIMNTSTPTSITSANNLYATQNMILPSQPVIFGMETVVSNTVMSSSHQFMAQSLTGANIGSSTLYSTTTTQVFQAAKQPNLSSGFIVLNTLMPQQASLETIQQPATLQEIKQVQQTQQVEPQMTVISDNSGDKCIYVHINNNDNNVSNNIANSRTTTLSLSSNNNVSKNTLKKSLPIIMKPVVKQVSTHKKNTKVMKVKNNRPVAIQTADNVITLANAENFITNTGKGHLYSDKISNINVTVDTKNLQIKTTTDKAVLCRNGEVRNFQITAIEKPDLCDANEVTKGDTTTMSKMTDKEMKCPLVVVKEENMERISNFATKSSPGVSESRTNLLYSSVLSKNSGIADSYIRSDASAVKEENETYFSIPDNNDVKSTPGISSPVNKPKENLKMIASAKNISNMPNISMRLPKLATAVETKKYLSGVPQTSIDSSKIAKVAVEKKNVANTPLHASNFSKEHFNGSNAPNLSGVRETMEKNSVSIDLPKENKLSAMNTQDFTFPLSRFSVKLTDIDETSKENTNLPSMPLLEHSANIVSDGLISPSKGTKSYLEATRKKYTPNIPIRNMNSITNEQSIKSMPILEPVKPTVSETDRIFDELLRQHKLSLKNKSTKEKITPKSRDVSSAEKEEKIVVEMLSSNEADLKSTEPPLVAKKAKKSPEKEKENMTTHKKSNTSNGSENKSWKTASISYEVNAEDGFTYKTNDLHDLWNKILESVQQSRIEYKLPLLPKNALINAESIYSLLGFENNASKYLLEQLPDAWKCIFYKPVFHKSSVCGKTSPAENVSGCARTEPFTSSHKFDMFGWLASRHRKPPKFMMISDSDIVNGNRRITSQNLPMAMRFRHLKETAKETIGVFRSDIHGRGLFCLRDIDAGEMVIEYAGEVIRSTLTDKREKYYTSKGIGCYMFRIDDRYVVDATMSGNAARFINHSCDPNCYSRIVDILGKKHILIFALRRIPKGEELTYDYKFPLEEDKIYCHCLARKCRKYLN